MISETWPPKLKFEPFVLGQRRGIGFWTFPTKKNYLPKKEVGPEDKNLNLHESPEQQLKLVDLLHAAIDLGKMETQHKVESFSDIGMIDRNPEKQHESIM